MKLIIAFVKKKYGIELFICNNSKLYSLFYIDHCCRFGSFLKDDNGFIKIEEL